MSHFPPRETITRTHIQTDNAVIHIDNIGALHSSVTLFVIAEYFTSPNISHLAPSAILTPIRLFLLIFRGRGTP